MRIVFRSVTACLLVVCVHSSSAMGQESTASDEAKTLKDLVEQAMDWYSIFPNRSEQKPLKPKPILRWGNAIRNSEVSEAVTSVFEYKGRPCVLMGVFPSGGDRINHEFFAVSREHGVVGRRKGEVVWEPDRSEVLQFEDLPNAKAPLKSKRLRLLQMKKMAERFVIELTGDIDRRLKDRVLQRQAAPVHRYGMPETSTLDGTIFAFCIHGNDPEAFLFIEAYRSDDSESHTWQYAIAKFAGGRLQAKLDRKKVVWDTKRETLTSGPSGAGHFIWIPVDHAHLLKKQSED